MESTDDSNPSNGQLSVALTTVPPALTQQSLRTAVLDGNLTLFNRLLRHQVPTLSLDNDPDDGGGLHDTILLAWLDMPWARTSESNNRIIYNEKACFIYCMNNFNINLNHTLQTSGVNTDHVHTQSATLLDLYVQKNFTEDDEGSVSPATLWPRKLEALRALFACGAEFGDEEGTSNFQRFAEKTFALVGGHPAIFKSACTLFTMHRPWLLDSTANGDVQSVRRLLNQWCRIRRRPQYDRTSPVEIAQKANKPGIGVLLSRIAPSIDVIHHVLACDVEWLRIRAAQLTAEEKSLINVSLKHFGCGCASVLYFALKRLADSASESQEIHAEIITILIENFGAFADSMMLQPLAFDLNAGDSAPECSEQKNSSSACILPSFSPSTSSMTKFEDTKLLAETGEDDDLESEAVENTEELPLIFCVCLPPIKYYFSELSNNDSLQISAKITRQLLQSIRCPLHRLFFAGRNLLQAAVESGLNRDCMHAIIEKSSMYLLCDYMPFDGASLRELAFNCNNSAAVHCIDNWVLSWLPNSCELEQFPSKTENSLVLKPNNPNNNLSLAAVMGYDFSFLLKTILADAEKYDNIIIKSIVSDLKCIQSYISLLDDLIESQAHGDTKLLLSSPEKDGDSALAVLTPKMLVRSFAGVVQQFSPKLKFLNLPENFLWYARRRGDGQTLLHRAVLFGHYRAAAFILKQTDLTALEFDIQLDRLGASPLHYAVGLPTSAVSDTSSDDAGSVDDRCNISVQFSSLLLKYGIDAENVVTKAGHDCSMYRMTRDTVEMRAYIKCLQARNYAEARRNEPWSARAQRERQRLREHRQRLLSAYMRPHIFDHAHYFTTGNTHHHHHHQQQQQQNQYDGGGQIFDDLYRNESNGNAPRKLASYEHAPDSSYPDYLYEQPLGSLMQQQKFRVPASQANMRQQSCTLL